MNVQRKFIIGEEWFYVKLYSGPKILEEFLLNEIFLLLKQLYTQEIIDKYFFVRSIEEDYHIRMRFRLVSRQKISSLIILLSEKIKPYSHRRRIYRIVVDTYNREIEKYGRLSIEHIETIFNANSLEVMNLLREQEDYTDRWLGGIKIMDNMLNKFGLTLLDKYELYQNYFLKYVNEFGINESLKNELKINYRIHSARISEIIDKKLTFVPDFFKDSPKNSMNVAVNAILNMVSSNQLEISFSSLLENIMHMHYNRLFRIKQRLHEFVIYYMMSNYYKSANLRES